MTTPQRSRVRRVTPDAPRGTSTPTKQASSTLPDMAVYVLGHAISVNAAYAGRKPTSRNRGTRRLSDAAVAWRETVITDCRAWMSSAHVMPRAWRLPLTVRVTVYGVRGDVDNYAKLICDGLKHALGYDARTGKLLIDDKHFQAVTMARGTGDVVPGCLIEVWQAAEAAEGQGAA